MTTVAIAIAGLHKRFEGAPVLQGVDLMVEPGELMVIVGGSGEGKSVLLRHIAGLELPDQGTVRVCHPSVGKGLGDGFHFLVPLKEQRRHRAELHLVGAGQT